MSIRQATLLLVALLPAALAQNSVPVEGHVTSSATRAGIGGVTVGSGDHRTTTDSSGAFRLTGLPPGEHAFAFEAEGFVRHETKARLDSSASATRIDVELIPHSSISGRVLDEDGHPLEGIAVEITEAVRGTGTTWSIWGGTTDRDGLYRQGEMPPGTYLVMARPNPVKRDMQTQVLPQPKRAPPPPKANGTERRAWVNTFYPSLADRGQAAKIVLRGGTHAVADVRLLAAPVYAIRGTVYDPAGKPANATVSLARSDESNPTELFTRPKVEARGGVFEFPTVPSGDWRVVAESGGSERELRGIGVAVVNGQDIENVSVRMAASFALAAVPEPRQEGRVTVELHAVDYPFGGSVFSQTDADGILRFSAVYPGRYRLDVFAQVPGRYLDAVLVGEDDVVGKEFMLVEGMPPMRILFKPNSNGVRGTVENGAGMSVLALPQDEGLWNSRFIRRVSCDSSGRFEIAGMRAGKYYVVAPDRVVSTGLDDLAILRALASMAETVQVESGRFARADLKPSPWPE